MKTLIKDFVTNFNLNAKTVGQINQLSKNAILVQLPKLISHLLNDKNLIIKGSVGVGARSEIPWISILDKRITKTTQSGLYIVYLFKSDLSGCYLSLGQGATDLKNKYKRNRNLASKKIVDYFRNNISINSFNLTNISLGNGELAKSYENTCLYSLYYDFNKKFDYDYENDLKNIYLEYKKIAEILDGLDYGNICDEIINNFNGSLTELRDKIMKNNIDGFTWVSFYKELADNIVTFNSKRDELIDLAVGAFEHAGIKCPLVKADGTKVLDIDPFTFFSCINRSPFKDESKIKVLEYIKQYLTLKSEVPSDFKGIPTRNAQAAWFCGNEILTNSEGNKNIDDLWRIFEIGTYLADGKCEFENEFNDLYIKCKHYYRVGYSISIGLFWIRPEYYMPLDENNRSYLVVNNIYSCKEVENDTSNEIGAYLKLSRSIAASVSSIISSCKTIYELSAAIYELKNNASTCFKTKLFDYNSIYYGVPGCGKSYKVDKEIENHNVDLDNVFRVVFHSEYSYSDFVGQVMPNCEDGSLKYEFAPGIFTLALKKALQYENDCIPVILVIEELNRGNAPAIFGDIFQLLDRDDDGKSVYTIKNQNIAKTIFPEKDNAGIYIPSNLFIIATMNTSDQNVFTLDTAFKRRWTLHYIDDICGTEYENVVVPNIINNIDETNIINSITWNELHDLLNEIISFKLSSSINCDDKGIGYYFIKKSEFNNPALFGEKLFQYLWFDVFNMHQSEVFTANSFRELIHAYEKNPLKLFGSDLTAIFQETVRTK